VTMLRLCRAVCMRSVCPSTPNTFASSGNNIPSCPPIVNKTALRPFAGGEQDRHGAARFICSYRMREWLMPDAFAACRTLSPPATIARAASRSLVGIRCGRPPTRPWAFAEASPALVLSREHLALHGRYSSQNREYERSSVAYN
jgi:hypothetical protein